MKHFNFKTLFLVTITLSLNGCVGIPDGIQPVAGFELDRYLGKWYEIARLDHSFERGLSNVSAEYSLRDDGGISVINRGFDREKNAWKVATGKAYFIDEPDVGRLKVSFFGPFYGGYNIFALDKQAYQYSMVAGPDLSYLWILARSPELDQATVDALLTKARNSGFATGQLIFVSHNLP